MSIAATRGPMPTYATSPTTVMPLMLPPICATRSKIKSLRGRGASVASGVGTRVSASIALGNGVKVYDEVRVGIARATDDIVAIGRIVGVADAQAISRPDSKNNAKILFISSCSKGDIRLL
jgi:hypothetical protein